MANRQSERRPADVHLRAEGNHEQVAESETSLKVWRRRQLIVDAVLPSKSQAGGKMVNEAEDSIVTEIIKQLFQEMKFWVHESLSF